MDGLGRTCLLIKKANLHSGFLDIKNFHSINIIFNKHHLSLTSLIRFFGRRLYWAVTYSPDFSVPSARRGLTSLFGMGRGGSPALLPPFLLRFASVGRLGSDGLVVALRACTLRVNSDGSVACVRFVLRFCALRLVLFCLCRPIGG